MENKTTLTFYGSGSKFFGIQIVNLLLTMVTLGFYYPWAKAATLKYLYGEAEMHNSRFAFHGTGKEMFKGFIKAVAFIVVIYCAFFLFTYIGQMVIGVILLYVGILAIIPLAIHGSMKYRMSRTSWRGIHFGYRGELKALAKNYTKDLLLTILTLGIYSSWLTVNIRNYTLSNVRLGDVKVNYKANGADFFFMYLKGYFLTLLTLGIYSFWWIDSMYKFYINHIELEQDGNKIKLEATTTGGSFFKILVSNFFITVFTLGIGTAWANIRMFRFMTSNIKFNGDLDPDKIRQTEENYKDATGEDLSDMLDLGIV